jgi:hypothetical protein
MSADSLRRWVFRRTCVRGDCAALGPQEVIEIRTDGVEWAKLSVCGHKQPLSMELTPLDGLCYRDSLGLHQVTKAFAEGRVPDAFDLMEKVSK